MACDVTVKVDTMADCIRNSMGSFDIHNILVSSAGRRGYARRQLQYFWLQYVSKKIWNKYF